MVRFLVIAGALLAWTASAHGQMPGGAADQLRDVLSDELRERLQQADPDEPDSSPDSDASGPGGHYIARTIRCPTPFVVEVTSEIPAGWSPAFRSATSDRPSRVAVEAYGGAGERLKCFYGSEDIFMLHMAPPADMPQCEAVDLHFVCRPEGDYINVRDEIVIQPSHQVDLDYSWAGEANDFWFRADTPTSQSLEAIGNARLVQTSFPPGGQPARTQCESMVENVGQRSYSLSRLSPGTVFCYRSTSGRYGYFEVLGHEGAQPPYALRLRYLAWAIQ